MSFKINKQNKIRKDVCVSLFSCVCRGCQDRGESSPTQIDGIHKGIHKHTSDKTWLISKWKQCINSVLNKLDKDNVEGLV